MGSGQNKLVLTLYHALVKHFWKEGQVCESWTNSWSWSLICRAMNCAQITGTALSWHGDCIGVQYGKTKTDKQGNKTCLVKHVFANPFQPWVDKISATFFLQFFPPHFFFTNFPPHLFLTTSYHLMSSVLQVCPFLCLGVMLMVYPFNGLRVNAKLLPRNNFRASLGKIIKAKQCTCGGFCPDDFEKCRCLTEPEQRRLRFVNHLIEQGIPFFKISTHSWRKGAGSFAASGSTVAPPIMSICIRAGWKIHAMLMRYLSQENAGDFFLGRVVAGLPQDTKKFAVLPPRFKSDLTAEQVRTANLIYNVCFPNDTKWGVGM